MSTRWHKVFRDLTGNKTRSALAILAITVGVTGFGSVLSTYSILIRELNTGYLATNPASATLWVDRVDDQMRAQIQTHPGIDQIEERRSLSARLRVGVNDWRNAVLFVIKDFRKIRVSTLQPEEGKWPPGDGEILIERDALGVAGAKIGDVALLRMPNGAEQSLRITGSVHDVGQAQARMEQIVYGYITLNTLEQLGEEPYLDQLKIVVSGAKFDEEHVRSTIAELRKWIENNGRPVRRVEIPRPGKHPHADLMGTLLLFKASFGLLALLLSSVLVMNLISALMAGQVRQIGIMKAIGARRKQIIGIYMSTVIVLSLFALCISIPAGIVAGRALATFMSRFLNFDLQSYAISFWVFGLQFLAGLIIPLAGALYPIFKGSRITIREAINDYGIDEKKFGQRGTDRIIAASGGMNRPMLLSIRNTFRRRGRLALIVATMAAGGSIFLAAWNVRASLIRTVDVMLSSFRYDLSLTFREFYPIQDLEKLIRKVPGVEHVESWCVAEAVLIGGTGSENHSFNIVAPSPNTKAISFAIVEGRPLQPDDRTALLLNQALADRHPAFRVGNSITVRIGSRTEKLEIAGLVRQPLAGASAYANFSYLSEVSGQTGRTKNVRVITTKHDAASMEAIKSRLETNLTAAGFLTASHVSIVERRRVIDEHNSVIYTFLIVMALLIVIVGGLGLMTIMSIQVLERRREIGVLRSIGATRNRVIMIILVEGSLIGMLSWIIAVPVSALISKEIGNLAASRILRTHLEFVFDPTGIAIWFMIVLFFGAVASFIPAWNASRNTVRELIEYE